MTYFTAEKSPYSPKDEWVIMSTDLLIQHFPIHTAYSLLPCRALRLSYANYLRMCRDKYGARLSGKNHRFVVPYFPQKEYAQELVNELNKRLTRIYQVYRLKNFELGKV